MPLRQVRRKRYQAVDAEEGHRRREVNLVELENIPSMVAEVWSDDSTLQLNATTQFRKLLSIERSPPIDEVVQSGVVPRMVEFMVRDDLPQLQFEVAWTGTSVNTKIVIDHGAIPIFVKPLSSSSNDVREQVVWALGNVAGDSPSCRDLVLSHGALVLLLAQLNEHTKRSMLRNVTWTLSNFCRGKPWPTFDQVRPALPALERLIHSSDEEVLPDTCWALSHLLDDTNDQIPAVIDAGVCARLVELLLHPSSSVFVPALRTIGNIVTGNDLQTQSIIDNGALLGILSLLIHAHKKSIKKEVCRTMSNITAGNGEGEQIEAVLKSGLIPPLINLLQNAEFNDKKEVAWAISNAIIAVIPDQIKYLVSQGCIKSLCDLLECADPWTVKTCLYGLESVLKVGEAERNFGNIGDINIYVKQIDAADGVKKIKNLQSHDNEF